MAAAIDVCQSATQMLCTWPFHAPSAVSGFFALAVMSAQKSAVSRAASAILRPTISCSLVVISKKN